MAISCVIGAQNFHYPSDFSRGVCRRAAVLSGDKNRYFAINLNCRTRRVQGDRADGFMVVFGKDKNSHQITLASLRSLSRSSSTSATMIPPVRTGGSSTFRISKRGVTSTPKSSGVINSMSFFLAFIMLGSEA